MSKSDLRVFITADAQNFNKNIKAALGQLVNFSNVAKNVGSSIKNVLVGAFAVQSALVFFDKLILAGSGFEDQMARVKAVSNATTKEFLMMRKEAAKLGATTRYSARQAASALENLTRNGLDARRSTKALSGVLELAGANAVELAEAADIVTNTMNMFGLRVENLNKINDVLSKTTASSATNLTDLYEALKYAAPTANLFGINIEEVNAALGTLANIGVKGSLAGTTLRSILNSLINPSAEAAAELAKYGLEINETTIKVDGLIGTLQKLKDAGLSASSSGTIFGKMFGGYAQSLINNNDLTNQLNVVLQNSTGEAARMFAEGAGEFNTAIDNFSSAFEGAMIKAFDAVKPALTSTINGFTELINVLSDLPTIGMAVSSVLGGLAGKELAEIRKEVKNTNATIDAHTALLNNFKKYSNEGGLYFLLLDGRVISEYITNIKLLKKEAANVEFPFKQLQKVFKELDTDALEKVYEKLVNISNLRSKFGENPLKIDSIIQMEDLDGYLNLFKNELLEFRDEINKGNLFKFGNTKEARQHITLFKKAIEDFAKTISNPKFKTLHEVIEEIDVQLGLIPKKINTATTAFGKFKNYILNVGKSILSVFGGPINLAITAITAGLTFVVSGFRKMGQAVRESKEAMNEAISESNKLDTTFRAVVNELASLEKGSIAWETRLKYLQQQYPELTEELRLHEIYLNSNSDAYKNLASSMDEVIKRQNKINLADAAVAARDRLNKTYADNDFGWLSTDTSLKRMEEYLTDKYSSEADKIGIDAYMSEIMTILASTITDELKKVKIGEVIEKINKEFEKVQFNANDWANNILNDYNKRVGNEIKGLDKYLNHETHEGVKLEDVTKYIEKAGKLLDQEITNIKKDAEAKYTDPAQREEYIASETKRFASLLLDGILTEFKGITIDGKDVRDIFKSNEIFNRIAAEAAKVSVVTAGTSGDDDPKQEAEDRFAKTMQTLAAECEKDLITTEEFNQRHLAAIEALISTYRDLGEVYDDVYAELIAYRNSVSELIKATEDEADAAAKAAEKKAESDRLRNDISSQYDRILKQPSGISKWSENIEEERINHLSNQLNDLINLRDSIPEGELLDWADKLDDAILKLSEHVLKLDDAFLLENATKALQELKEQADKDLYNSVMNNAYGIINLGDSLKTLNNISDVEGGWERFATGLSATLSFIDTLVSMAESIEGVVEIFGELGKKREALNAIEAGSTATQIASIEAEAAAVVAGETAKTAAKESAAVANIAAMAAQTEAAQILMAAESAAAYAGIPFAGVGLAAALIAELKALIMASSLPAFANGGIVGGNSTVGDLNLVRVNSGEMILNDRQQRNLFNLLDGKGADVSTGSQVEFKIKGSELVGVLNNYNGKMKKLR